MKGLALVLLLWLCACGSVGRPTGAQPSSTPLSDAELQYRLVDTVGAPVYCDPFLYPVARIVDPAEVARMVALLRSQHPDEFAAIVRHEHLDPTRLSPDDNVRVVRQASQLAAVPLMAQGEQQAFSYEVAGPPPAEVRGTIDRQGTIAVTSRTPAQRRPCPLAAQGPGGA